jgi:hypothetical protein
LRRHMMSTPMSVDSLSPAILRALATREQDAENERDAQARSERWPMSLDIRNVVVELALELSGLEVNPEGAVTRMVPTEEKPRPKPRTRLAAMRIIASCDKLSLEQRKIDLVENPSSEDDDTIIPGDILNSLKTTSEVMDEVKDLMLNQPKELLKVTMETGRGREPIAIPRKPHSRWPITRGMRCAIIEQSLELCGYSITGAGKLARIPVTDETPKPKQRIMLGAMRILTQFDRLSIVELKLKQRVRRYNAKRRFQRRKNEVPGMTWEMLGTICEMVEEEARAWMAQVASPPESPC